MLRAVSRGENSASDSITEHEHRRDSQMTMTDTDRTAIGFRRVRPLPLLAAGLLAAGLAACGESLPTPPEELDGGVLATFEVQSERFHVWTRDPGTIQRLEALEEGESRASIPNGALRRGPGPGELNAPWAWHMAPDSVEMTEVAAEVCDGKPSFVESEVDYFVDEVGRYCPWSAELVGLQDVR